MLSGEKKISRREAAKITLGAGLGFASFHYLPPGASISKEDGPPLPDGPRMWVCLYCHTPKGLNKSENGLLVTASEEMCPKCGGQTYMTVGKLV